MDKLGIDDLFDRRLTYPDLSARKRFARLVGIDEAKSRLRKLLGILVNPTGPRAWARKHHKDAPTLIDYVERRPPLVILAGMWAPAKPSLPRRLATAWRGRKIFPLHCSR